MDSGATHATPRRDMFVTYRNRDFGAVKLRNKDVSQIIGIEDVHLERERRVGLSTQKCQTCPRFLIEFSYSVKVK